MKKILAILVLAVLAGVLIFKLPKYKKAYENYHYASYSDKSFYAIDGATPDKVYEEKVYGGIISHHLYVSSEIAKFFAGLKNQHPKTVVLVGPNHYNVGDSDVLVSKYPYQTAFGVLEPDNVVISSLLRDNIFGLNEKPFEMEHSIAADVTYVKAFFPEAKLVPIILKRNTPKETLDKIVADLNKALPPDSIVIASVDFSHHNKEIVSEFHDKKSISAIENFDLDNVFNLEIDSPPSIYTLLKYLEGKGAQKMTYTNTNSAIFGANYDSEDVTSYVFAYFTKGTPKTNGNVTILNFGDMMFDRGVRGQMKKGKDPFEFLRGVEGNFLKGVDFIVGNLEGPIIETPREKCQTKAYNFQFASTTNKMLYDNNFDLVNIANNHAYDCYRVGVDSTIKYLDAYKIGHSGGPTLETSYQIEKSGNHRIAFVGIDETTRPIPVEDFYPLVKKLKSENDYVIVNIHWGYEYNKTESKIQEDIAHNLIDNGVDVIFGHHPHVVQPVKLYKGKPIFYSLGNLIFDQQGVDENQGVGAGVVIDGNKISGYVFPYNIISTQPKFMLNKEAEDYCKGYLKSVTEKDGCKFKISDL